MEAVKVENLEKFYGDLHALKDINMEVHEGEIFGIIGPNGSGKTTLLECILGLRPFNKGFIHVNDIDVTREHKKLVYEIGAQLQECTLSKSIKVKEAVHMQAALFHVKVDVVKLLEHFGLEKKMNTYFSNLSGGQKQKLFILLAQLHNPSILVFDELSTGLDPIARSSMWKDILELKKQGKTILISTHYMEEASYICDRLIMLKNGNIISYGTPTELIAQLPFRYIASMCQKDYQLHKEQLNNFEISEIEGQKVLIHLNTEEERNQIFLLNDDGKELQMTIRNSDLDDFYQYKMKENS